MELAAQGGSVVRGVQETGRCGSGGCGLLGMVEMG